MARKDLQQVKSRRAKLKEPPAQIARWHVDAENYRLVPFLTDNTMGPSLNLRQLFALF
jgi:hypothetical protein